MAPFFGSDFLYTRPRRRRSLEPKTTAPDSSLPLNPHSKSLPNLEQLHGLSASFLGELTPPLQSCPAITPSSPSFPPVGTNTLQNSTLAACKSTQALRIVKRSAPGDIADLLPGKGAVRKVKAIRKHIRELHHGIDELYDSFHQMQYPAALAHHLSEFRCLLHGYPIKVLDDHLDAMREGQYPLEKRIEALKLDNGALKFENNRLNNQLDSVKNDGRRMLHERDHRIRELNHFIAALLDVKSNIKTEPVAEGKEKPPIDVTVVAAIHGAAKNENSLWATILPAVLDQSATRLFLEEILRNPKLQDELRQFKRKYGVWKALAQRNPEHATFVTPSPSKMSLVPGGNALQQIKNPEPPVVDEIVDRLYDGNFTVKHPPYFEIDSPLLDPCTSAPVYPVAAQADVMIFSPVNAPDPIVQTPIPSPTFSDLVRAIPSVSACSIFSSDTESEDGSVSSSTYHDDADINQSPKRDGKCPERVPFDAALFANDKSPTESIYMDSDEQTKSPVPDKERAFETPSLRDVVTKEAEIIDTSQEGLRQYVKKCSADGLRNPVLCDLHKNASQDMPMLPQQLEHQKTNDVDDQIDPVVPSLEPLPNSENTTDSKLPKVDSILSSIASSSSKSLKRLSSAGSSIKKSISNGLEHLRQLSFKSPQSPKDDTKQGISTPRRPQMSSTQGKENIIPKTKQGKSATKATSLPPRQISAPSRSRRPTISSTLKAVNNNQLTTVTPDRPLKPKHQKMSLVTDSPAVHRQSAYHSPTFQPFKTMNKARVQASS